MLQLLVCLLQNQIVVLQCISHNRLMPHSAINNTETFIIYQPAVDILINMFFINIPYSMSPVITVILTRRGVSHRKAYSQPN